jgi:hypothetical protein
MRSDLEGSPNLSYMIHVFREVQKVCLNYVCNLMLFVKSFEMSIVSTRRSSYRIRIRIRVNFIYCRVFLPSFLEIVR